MASVEILFMRSRVFTLMRNEGGRKFNQEFADVTVCDLNQIAFHYRKNPKGRQERIAHNDQ